MYAENPSRALVGGTAVNMHPGCKAEYDKEQEALTDEEIQGTQICPPPEKQDEEGAQEAPAEA